MDNVQVDKGRPQICWLQAIVTTL